LNFSPDLSDFEDTVEKALEDLAYLNDTAVAAAGILRAKYDLRQHADDFARIIIDI
jgi:hypothetical protein